MERETYSKKEVEAETTDNTEVWAENKSRHSFTDYGKRAMAGVLLAATLVSFSGCGEKSENAGAISTSGSAIEESGSMESQQTGPESTDETLEKIFEQGESQMFVVEKDGYSLQVQVNTWEGVQGTGEAWEHPGDENIMLPAVSKSDCIIPFEVNMLVGDTEGDFDTSFHIGVGGGFKGGGVILEGWKGGSWSNVAKSGLWEDSPGGTRITKKEYLLIQNYYSPTHPNGDTNRFNQDERNIEGITVEAQLVNVPSDDNPQNPFSDERLFKLVSTDDGLKLTMVDPDSYLH
jgi:hypothetical protein